MNTEIDKVNRQIAKWRSFIIETSKKVVLAQQLVDEQFAIEIATNNLKESYKNKWAKIKPKTQEK